MVSNPPPRLYRTLFLLAFLLAAFGVAGGCDKADANVLQRHTVTATPTTHTWLSTRKGAVVNVYVRADGQLVAQEYVNQCKARYHNAHVVVVVQIVECGAQHQPYTISYHSSDGTNHVVSLELKVEPVWFGSLG